MTPMNHIRALGTLSVLTAGSAWAQGGSLFTEGGLQAARQPLFDHAQADRQPPSAMPQPLMLARAEVSDTAEAEDARGRAQSLFVGRASGGLFAPLAPRNQRSVGTMADPGGPIRGDDPQVRMLRDLIAQAEAGPDGYNAVQHGAWRRPDRLPTDMTLADIFAWIEATPGQPHAIGRYQFIPPTLTRLADVVGAGPDDRFSPGLQDRLADVLLHEAGLAGYRSGGLTRHQFMNNLARIWAGLPNSSGRSHYHGYAGNAATMSWPRFDSEMARIFQG